MKNQRQIMRRAPEPIPAAAGLGSELAYSFMMGVTGIRRMILRTILFVALLAAVLAFTAGVMLRDYLPDLTHEPGVAETQSLAEPADKPPPAKGRRAESKRAPQSKPDNGLQAAGH